MKLPQKKPPLIWRTVWVVLILFLLGGAAYMVYGGEVDHPAVEPAMRGVEESVEQAETEDKFAAISETPTRIKIDEIGVDAPIEPVGLTADGLMAAPDTNELVGWYDQSARAGEDEYAMLLDGHYGSDTEPAVFRDLADLELGDSIEIIGDGGSKLRYEVVESYQRYAEDVDMKKALYPYRDGAQSLTIITCEGLYDPVNISYDKRTVVYAIRVA